MKPPYRYQFWIRVALLALAVWTMVLSGSTTAAAYNGNLRLYMVEPESRYRDESGSGYSFGLLGYALSTGLSIPDNSVYSNTVTWSWPGITEDNIMVIAVVFDNTGHTNYSNPPSGNPFTAHDGAAAAAATSGMPGFNKVIPGTYTHTVFLEEGTAGWCIYCPATRIALESVWNTHLYNFYYAALVDDSNSAAAARNTEFNIWGFPTVYGDGGYNLYIGGTTSQTPYRNMITINGARAVADLGLYVTLQWLGSEQVEVHVEVANGNQAPAVPSAPTGPISGKAGRTYGYSDATSDPETNDLFYQWVWAEGDTSAWLGSYGSGLPCSPTHSWPSAGSYSVKVRARDYFGKPSDWSDALPVTMYTFTCGDANTDTKVNVADATFLINYVFVPGSPPPVPIDRGNVNCDTKTNVADATYIINYVFVPGSPMPCANCP